MSTLPNGARPAQAEAKATGGVALVAVRDVSHGGPVCMKAH
jgi:hypothetical protein